MAHKPGLYTEKKREDFISPTSAFIQFINERTKYGNSHESGHGQVRSAKRRSSSAAAFQPMTFSVLMLTALLSLVTVLLSLHYGSDIVGKQLQPLRTCKPIFVRK